MTETEANKPFLQTQGSTRTIYEIRPRKGKYSVKCIRLVGNRTLESWITRPTTFAACAEFIKAYCNVSN